MVEKLRLIETELAGALSADLRAALGVRQGRRRGRVALSHALTPYICTSSSPSAAGTYLVDLLNAVAAITGGGGYITLSQLAGVAGSPGPVPHRLRRLVKDNAKWILLFVVVWGAMIVPKTTVRVVDRLDPALAPAVVATCRSGLRLFASLTSQVGAASPVSPSRRSPFRTTSSTAATG